MRIIDTSQRTTARSPVVSRVFPRRGVPVLRTSRPPAVCDRSTTTPTSAHTHLYRRQRDEASPAADKVVLRTADLRIDCSNHITSSAVRFSRLCFFGLVTNTRICYARMTEQLLDVLYRSRPGRFRVRIAFQRYGLRQEHIAA